MRNLVATIFVASVMSAGTLRSLPQQHIPVDVEKARRLLAIEMDRVHRSLVAYRNELVVGRSGDEREAHARIWFRTRRSHVQIAADMKNTELDREGTIRLLLRARELHRDLRRLLDATQPELPVVSVIAPNDDCGNALSVGNGTFNADTTMATDDGNSSCGFNTGNDVWYAYTAPQGGEIAFETFGSDYDTVLSLHAACPGTTANELACNDNYRSVTSRVLRTMTAGETVWVRAAGYNRSSGSLALNIGLTGSIEGTVLETVTLTPIESHRVDLWRSEDHLDGTFTDDAGQYAFTGLTPGTYTVEARGEVPYLGELFDDIECHDFACDRTMGTPVIVDGGMTTSGIDFVLDFGGAIQGTVTAALDGTPIENVYVDIFDPSGRWMTNAFTEALGTYLTSSALPTGIYMAHTNGRDRFWGELYNELPCPDFCDVT
ncbi:MAG TPA: carboxypeptidase-like regulatory domain-containing protein, partial [Vicinamibacteria bacterium]|nr:carboxypeptidase-like regulatory domain-containing protein [Vicinamibacteria bacterium]